MVSFGVLVFMFIWILVILGKVFKFSDGKSIVEFVIMFNSSLIIKILLFID